MATRSSVRLPLISAASVLLFLPPCPASPPAQPAKPDRLAWWREARFGMFIHWGPVSLKGTEISWSRANSNPAHPNKGLIPVQVYDNLYRDFDPKQFDATEWARLARSAGMKYMILTAKHCDGFCLWNSRIDDYSIAGTPFRRDVCAELAKAAREQGLRIGWYYSPMDWRDPDCRTERNAAYVARMHGHLRELLSGYGPISLLWFDTDGCPAPWDQERTYRLVRSLQPEIIINNRLDLGSMSEYEAMPIAPQADYYTPEQRVGNYDDRRPWETCMTLGSQWSWKPNDRIKSTAECVRILARCAGGDGNLLLNVGPMPTGQIEPRQADVLRGIGKWLERNGESIYGTRGGPYLPTENLASTRRGNVVYLIVLKGSPGPLVLPELPARVVSASTLDGREVKTGSQGGKMNIILPAAELDAAALVIRVMLDSPADGIPVIALPGSPRR
ncbi:MAG: alpha-L-fucosidase [Isosphaeraceae bacterium]